ncbi:MAG: hypothetical protein V5A34_01690 [Halapricum sp.]
MEGYQCSITATVGSADRIEVVFESHGSFTEAAASPGDVLATFRDDEEEYLTFAPKDDLGNGPLYFGNEVSAVAVTGSERERIAHSGVA